MDEFKKKISPILVEANPSKIRQLEEVFRKYRKRMTLNFLFMPQIYELLNIIKPIKILITDNNKVATLSYLKGIEIVDNAGQWDISVSSEVFNFIFTNDFGFNTTHVNGRFRLGQNKKILDIVKFFTVQEYCKNGFGIKHPFISGRYLIRQIVRLVLKKLTKPTQP